MSVKSLTAPWGQFIAPVMEGLRHGELPSDARDIYKGRNRVMRATVGGREINIKQFKIPNIINRLVYTTFRHSKARRSYENSLRLRNLGFNTPEPLGYLEIRKGPLLGKSYFISQQLENFHELRTLLPDEHPGRLADQLAAMMARLHNYGIWVKDFSQGNVLRRLDARNNYLFFLVDLNRMEFDVSDRRKLMKNFSRITDDRDFWYSLVRAYARHSRLPYARVLREAHQASGYRFLNPDEK